MPTEKTTPPSADSAALGGFGDDDLGRLQGILLGDHAKRTSERIDTLEKALVGAVDDLRAAIEERISAIEGRLDGEADTRAKALANVSDRLAEETRMRENAERSFRVDVDRDHEKMTDAIDALEQRASTSISETRSELAAEMQAGLESLGDVSVARADLAAALIRAAEQISGGSDS